MKRTAAHTLVELLVATALVLVLLSVLSVVFVGSQEIATRSSERLQSVQRVRLFQERVSEDLAGAREPPGGGPAIRLVLGGGPSVEARSDRLFVEATVRATRVEYELVPGSGLRRSATPYTGDGVREDLLPEAAAFRVRWTRGTASGTAGFHEPNDETATGAAFRASSLTVQLAEAGHGTCAVSGLPASFSLARGARLELLLPGGARTTRHVVGFAAATGLPLLEGPPLAAGSYTASAHLPPVALEVTLVVPERDRVKRSLVRVLEVGAP